MRLIPPARLADLPERGGLDEAQSADRRARYGANDIITAPPSTWLTLVRDTLRDPMLWFLVGMSGLLWVTGDHVESMVLGAALAPLIGMDAFLHRRTQVSTRSLAGRLAARTRVIRPDGAREVTARDLAPGDLVEVGPGEPFPADGLLLEGDHLQADESSLTGESLPVGKQVFERPIAEAGAVDTVLWGFAGSRLLTGPARMRVVFTGAETVYGEIVRSAVLGSHAHTPLQKAVARLVTIMLAGALALCLALAAIRFAQGHGWLDALISAATLAIAALPEEFPVVFTFFLGVGVYRLAQRQALVRRAVAVENIGRISCICSDKTGTLTEGRLKLAHVGPAGDTNERTLRIWAGSAARPDSGDPLDAALIEAAPRERPRPRRLRVFPFTEDRRRETAVLKFKDGGRLAIVKGAPETVLAMCDLKAPEAKLWRGRADGLAAEGHKVIALASRELGEDQLPDQEPDSGLRFDGLLALEDPVRPGVRQAIDACAAAGLRVIMITGDHPSTAAAIATEVGLGGGRPKVVLADSLDGPEGLSAAGQLRGVDVIARAAPGQKLRLVQALQAAGEIVAVTGDGVNDVPALQTADVGVAMGERGTQSAREVASIVLLDDNFRTIVRAIAEGRQLFENLKLSFAYVLLIHIPLVLTAAAIPLAGHPLLYLPIHVVWLELIIHPTALLVFQELPTSDRLPSRRRDGPARFFTPAAWAVITAAGLVLAAIVFFGFESALRTSGDTGHARAFALSVLIASGAASTAALSGLRTPAAIAVTLGGVASLILLVQIPPLARLVEVTPLHLEDWAYVSLAACVAGVLALVAKVAMREPAAFPTARRMF